jgi:hypothetical protein
MHEPKDPQKRDLDEPRQVANDNEMLIDVIEIDEIESERVSFDEDDKFDFSDDDELADVDDMFK